MSTSNPAQTQAAEYTEAPHPSPGIRPGVFLAGGISGCPNWHAEATVLLPTLVPGLPIAIYNPNRASFPIDDPNAASEQIQWEFDHLQTAKVILFWFPASGDVPQPIALYELGRYAALGRAIAVGADPQYIRRDDVVIQLALGRPELRVHDSLDATCRDAARQLRLHTPRA